MNPSCTCWSPDVVALCDVLEIACKSLVKRTASQKPHPHLQERKAVEQWLEAASRSMDAAKEPLNAFHWETRRMVTTEDLIKQLRSTLISREILDKAKPGLEQARCCQSLVC